MPSIAVAAAEREDMIRYFLAARPFSLLLGLSVVLASQAPSASADDATTVAAIKKIGGSVRPIREDSEDWEVAFRLRGRELTDDGLVHVAALKNVVSLDLRDTRVTSEGVSRLKSELTECAIEH